ncbi:MAG TPA: dienelactone hydrolase family protein [Steroidobacteraceae bacterium]|nr:dienelactone hydrolase family protein [Steroidobacteraceae bacterium]
MCDQHDFDEMDYARRIALSRRQFGLLSVGAGLASLLPAPANAAPVTGKSVDIRTPDGLCDAYFTHPTAGTHPGVLMWPDIFGLRPTFQQMADRLARSGYSVLVVNPFYRIRKAPTSPPHPDFNDPATRKELMGMMHSLTPGITVADAHAFVPWLERQPAVSKTRKMASTGYCMGGPFTLRTAAEFPERIGAGATFHGAALVTDGQDSPHLLIPRMKAQYLMAIAESDDKKQPDAKTILRDAFAKAHLPAEIEVYPDTAHGWCVPDSQVYNHDQAERAWARQLALLERALA